MFARPNMSNQSENGSNAILTLTHLNQSYHIGERVVPVLKMYPSSSAEEKHTRSSVLQVLVKVHYLILSAY